MLDHKRFPAVKFLPEVAIGNAEYKIQITHTISTDTRIMSFVDILWGFEVTGGFDQWEPLTIISVRRSGYAFRAGLRLNDRITRINDTYADTLTLREAQMLIRRSGKHLKIYVVGNEDPFEDDEFTVDFWFCPPRGAIFVEDQWDDQFPWNDRKKRPYKESNCFMVPSKEEERIIRRELERPPPPEPSEDNAVVVVDQSLPKPFSREMSEEPDEEPKPRPVIVPVVDESNETQTAPENKRTVKKFLLVK